MKDGGAPPVLPQEVRSGLQVGGRLDTREVEPIEVRDVIQDGAELPGEAVVFLGAELEIRETGDVTDFIAGDGQGISPRRRGVVRAGRAPGNRPEL